MVTLANKRTPLVATGYSGAVITPELPLKDVVLSSLKAVHIWLETAIKNE